MTTNVSYKVVPNAMPTKDEAPYLGTAIAVDSLAVDNILERMLEGGTYMSKATATFFLEAFYELAADVIAAECVRLSIGSVSIFPNIGGGFDSEDAAFDPERNRLFVDAALSQALQEQVGALVPSLATAAVKSTVKINSAYDPAANRFGMIDGNAEFRLAGVGLTVPDGEDESLALWKTDLSEKVCDIAVAATDGGQRITVSLDPAGEVPAGKYKIRLASRGLDPTAKLAIVTLSVELTRAAFPKPTITSARATHEDDGIVSVSGDTISVKGTNLETVTAIELHSDVQPTGEASLWQTLPAVYEDGKLTTETLAFDTRPSETGFLRIVAAGGAATYPITYVGV